MIRHKQLNLEPLELRSLLSGLAYSLTTNQTEYQPGQPVAMTFQVTNESNHAVVVDNGPSVDGFNVSQGGAVVWRSNAGVNPLFIVADQLQPGQSLTLTATWDGIPTGGTAPVTGRFVISNQLNPLAATATMTILDSAASPTPPKSTPPPTDPPVTNPAPVSSPPVTSPVSSSSGLALSVTTNNPTYRPGHPVRMTVTLRNGSGRAIDLASNAHAGGFTVFEGSTAIWYSARSVPRRIQPGRSVKLTAIWHGGPTHAGTAIAPGTYTVEAVEAGHSGSTTFRVIG